MGSGQSLKDNSKEESKQQFGSEVKQILITKKSLGPIKLPPIQNQKSENGSSVSEKGGVSPQMGGVTPPNAMEKSNSNQLSNSLFMPTMEKETNFQYQNRILKTNTPNQVKARTVQKIQVFKYNMKKQETLKLAVVGSRPAVGKSTLIQSFQMQSVDQEDLQIQQTIGTDISIANFEMDDTVSVKLQIWEFESNDQSLKQWIEQLEKNRFDAIVMVFDEFGEGSAVQMRERIVLLKKIMTKENTPIMMVGNDRLNMMISGMKQNPINIQLQKGKESDIQQLLNRLYGGNSLGVRIIDMNQLKEINKLFRYLITTLIKMKQDKQQNN